MAVLALALTGCVANQTIRTVQLNDNNMSCEQLQAELATLGAKFEEAKNDSGVTGKNVGLAIVFWPGIIVNESRASKNQSSLDARISHLSSLYNGKCLSSDSGKTMTQKLTELQDLHEQGLITDQEYEAARAKTLNIKPNQ